MGVIHLKFARSLLSSVSIINSLLIFTATLGALPLDVLHILVGKFLKVIEVSKSPSSLPLEIGAVTSQLEK
jgi:hypothetical protein